MTVEVATFIGDLVPANPASSDLTSQGDDHLRLLKTVLQATFPSVEKAFYLPTTSASQTANFSIVAAQMNTTFRVDTTSGAITATLPSTLGAGDAGWECFILKTSFNANPVFIAPSSGTLTSGSITGLASARRNVPTSKISCYWTGTSWVIGRSQGMGGPVGSCIEYHGATLPFGYEWPNGQTLASASTAYPEYSAVIGSGVTLDKRSRVGIPLDNLGGSAAGRLAGGFITGTAVGNVGGVDNIRLAVANIPTITGTISGSALVQTTTTVLDGSPVTFSATTGGPTITVIGNGTATRIQVNSSGSISGTFASTNTGGASPTTISNLQPSIMVSQILVVE